MNIDKQAASASVQDLYFGLPVQESGHDWIANTQSTESDENHANLEEDTQSEVLA